MYPPFMKTAAFGDECLWGGISRHGSVGLFPKRKLSTAKRKQLSRFDALWRQTRGVAQSLRRRMLPCHAYYTPVRLSSEFDALWRQTRGVAQSLRRRMLPCHAYYPPVRRSSEFDALWRQTRGVAQSLRRRKLPRHAYYTMPYLKMEGESIDRLPLSIV